jgi:hypothetical protein
MSKRKPATTIKHSRSPKIAAKAQRAAQAIVPKHSVSTLRAGATWRTCDEPNLSDNPAVGTLHCTAFFEKLTN